MPAETIQLPARFDRSAVATVSRRLRDEIRAGARRIELDLSKVENFDSAGMACVVETLGQARRDGVDVHLVGVRESILDFFSLVSVGRLLDRDQAPDPVGFVERIGGAVIPAMALVRSGCKIVGEAFVAMCIAPLRGERARGGRVLEELHITGNGAVAIVALISFLLGLILAMQAWVQLRVFAAEIFVADMVAVSITREIGPLMTAILMAARSGSAIAAQLGTMVINEEVDALRQMGVHPLGYLVAPKIVALAIAGPCLTILFCAIGILGGLLFGVSAVGLDWSVYMEQTRTALHMSDLFTSLLKATVFGALVAAVGCTLGINVKGGPEGVGRATTRAVVTAIFLIIVVDALFVVLLRVGA